MVSAPGSPSATSRAKFTFGWLPGEGPSRVPPCLRHGGCDARRTYVTSSVLLWPAFSAGSSSMVDGV